AHEGPVEAFGVEVQRLRDAAEATALLDKLRGQELGGLAGAWEGAEGRSALLGLAISHDGEQVAWLDDELLADMGVTAALDVLLKERGVDAHDAKALMRSLWPLGVDFANIR